MWTRCDHCRTNAFPRTGNCGRMSFSSAWAVVDAVDGELFGEIVPIFEGKGRPWLRVDEACHMLGILVGEGARIQVWHCVADDPGQRIDASGPRAVIP